MVGDAGDDQLPSAGLERQHLVQPAARHEPAAREDRDAAAQRLGVAQHVRAEEDRASAVTKTQDERADVAPSQRVEARHRLVENHEVGIVEERLGDADPLQHALGKFAELQPPFAADADLIEQAARAPAAFRGVVAEERAEIHQQLLGGQVVVEVRVLRQIADPALDGQVAERPPQNFGAAAGREHELHEQLQRGRLARAVRTEKSEDLALADVERQAIERPIGTLPPEANAVVLGELEASRGLDRSR